tara:strand:+ start:951 stop:1550 length:600 start_codon:yes stop_codon:yes gene_type:complete
MKIHNFKQGTDEWHQSRLGKLTGSEFHVFFGKSKTRDTLLYKKASERITSQKSDQDSFSNIHTARGSENEVFAMQSYYFETGREVNEVGFVELNNWIGSSPDGLVGDDGIIEIKSPDNHTFLYNCNKAYIKPEYKTQIQFNLFTTGRKWCDFILYNPKFDKPLKIIRINRDDEFIDKIKKTTDEVIKEINDIINQFNLK